MRFFEVPEVGDLPKSHLSDYSAVLNCIPQKHFRGHCGGKRGVGQRTESTWTTECRWAQGDSITIFHLEKGY